MPFSFGIEYLEPAFPDRSVPYIAYGSPFDQLAAQHIPNTLNASRAYIVCSTSLAKNTDALSRLEHALKDAGVTVVGTRTGFLPHTRWNQVVDCANDARSKNPDVIITLGAGSLTDGVKVICWMLANDVTDAETLDLMNSFNPNKRTDWKPPKIRQVAIPTSLSGGEYQSIAGVTKDDGTDQKCLFQPPAMNPSLVILDPELTTTTPESIWLSTGVRAIDHCVETLCSLQSNEKGDSEAGKGLKRLVPALVRTKHDPKALDARFETMMGVIEAMSAVGSGVPLGASHAIGRQASSSPPLPRTGEKYREDQLDNSLRRSPVTLHAKVSHEIVLHTHSIVSKLTGSLARTPRRRPRRDLLHQPTSRMQIQCQGERQQRQTRVLPKDPNGRLRRKKLSREEVRCRWRSQGRLGRSS